MNEVLRKLICCKTILQFMRVQLIRLMRRQVSKSNIYPKIQKIKSFLIPSPLPYHSSLHNLSKYECLKGKFDEK